jgi:hypothetical protein
MEGRLEARQVTITIGRVDWAEWIPNPQSNKQYGGVNLGRNGIACHSVEGELNGRKFLARAFAPFPPTTNDLSNMFTLSYGGALYQHFPVTSQCWCSGEREANRTTWSVEAEGFGSQGPLTSAQESTMLRLFEEWQDYTGKSATRGEQPEVMWWDFRRAPADRTIWQHNEIVATACPSGRYNPTFAAWAEGDSDMGMTPEEKARIERLERIVGGEAANDIDLLVSINNLNTVVGAHIDDDAMHDGGGGASIGQIPDHTHGGVEA